MTPLFKKLNPKAHKTLHVLNAPSSFEPELSALQNIKIVRRVSGVIEFGLAFAVTQGELDSVSSEIARHAQGDAVVWVAYPKGTSKNYRCEFNRDSGWSVLGDAGYEPVRQVAIDHDWSALRFRKAEHIKAIARNPAGAISNVGRQRAGTK